MKPNWQEEYIVCWDLFGWDGRLREGNRPGVASEMGQVNILFTKPDAEDFMRLRSAEYPARRHYIKFVPSGMRDGLIAHSEVLAIEHKLAASQ